MTTNLNASRQIQDKHRMAVERCQVALAGLTHKLEENQQSMDAINLQIQHSNLALYEREQQFGIQFEWRAMTQRFIAHQESVLAQLQQAHLQLEQSMKNALDELNQHHVQVKVQERYVERVLREVCATIEQRAQHESDEVWSRVLSPSQSATGFSMFQTFAQGKP